MIRNIHLVSYLIRVSQMYAKDNDMEKAKKYGVAASNLKTHFRNSGMMLDEATKPYDYLQISGIDESINVQLYNFTDGFPKWTSEDLPNTELPPMSDKTAEWAVDNHIVLKEVAVSVIQGGVAVPSCVVRDMRYQRAHWWDGTVDQVVSALNSYPTVIADVVGSYSRDCHIIQNLNFIVHTTHDGLVNMLDDALTDSVEIVSSNVGRVSCEITNTGGNMISADFIIVRDIEEYMFMSLHYTGSKELNISMSEKANGYGWTLDQHGFWDDAGNRISGIGTERDVFSKLDMEYRTPKER